MTHLPGSSIDRYSSQRADACGGIREERTNDTFVLFVRVYSDYPPTTYERQPTVCLIDKTSVRTLCDRTARHRSDRLGQLLIRVYRLYREPYAVPGWTH